MAVESMDYETYAEEVRNKLRSEGFEGVEDIEDDRFKNTLAKREKGLKVGVLNTMATVVDAEGLRSGDLRKCTDDFRSLLNDESYAKFGVGENMFGYVIFAVADPDDELLEWYQDYDVRKRNSHVFPLIYDLSAENVHTHSVPRIKGRGLYNKQKQDAEEFFDLGDGGGGRLFG